MPTHLKGVPDFDASENRPQTARDAVIEKGPQASSIGADSVWSMCCMALI
jgi:hypothetical protein